MAAAVSQAPIVPRAGTAASTAGNKGLDRLSFQVQNLEQRSGLSLALKICFPHADSLAGALCLSLTLCTCTCCYDVIYGAQDGKMMCSHANSVILSYTVALTLP